MNLPLQPLPPVGQKVTYLRAGRIKRGSGIVADTDPIMRTVKTIPEHAGWKAVWVSEQEIADGQEKGPVRKREKKLDQPKCVPKPRTPKPPPQPEWKRLVARVRLYEIDHQPHGRPSVQMEMLTRMADELEKAHAALEGKFHL